MSGIKKPKRHDGHDHCRVDEKVCRNQMKRIGFTRPYHFQVSWDEVDQFYSVTWGGGSCHIAKGACCQWAAKASALKYLIELLREDK